jgi:hypothetical protein
VCHKLKKDRRKRSLRQLDGGPTRGKDESGNGSTPVPYDIDKYKLIFIITKVSLHPVFMAFGTPEEKGATEIINQAYSDARNGLIEQPGKSPALMQLLQEIEKAEQSGGKGVARYGFEVRGLLREAGMIE